MFGKKIILSEDRSFIELHTRVSNLELELEKLKTHINSLRGLINRRSKEIFEDLDQDETSKSPDGLDNLRSAAKHVRNN